MVMLVFVFALFQLPAARNLDYLSQIVLPASDNLGSGLSQLSEAGNFASGATHSPTADNFGYLKTILPASDNFDSIFNQLSENSIIQRQNYPKQLIFYRFSTFSVENCDSLPAGM